MADRNDNPLARTGGCEGHGDDAIAFSAHGTGDGSGTGSGDGSGTGTGDGSGTGSGSGPRAVEGDKPCGRGYGWLEDEDGMGFAGGTPYSMGRHGHDH